MAHLFSDLKAVLNSWLKVHFFRTSFCVFTDTDRELIDYTSYKIEFLFQKKICQWKCPPTKTSKSVVSIFNKGFDVIWYVGSSWKKVNRKVQGMPQSQTAANPRHQEEEKKDKNIHAQNKQTNVRKAQRPDSSSPSEVIRMLKQTEKRGQSAQDDFKTLSAPWLNRKATQN